MRTATAALTALISGGNREWVRADLFTVYDSAGAVLGRYTNADRDLTIATDGSAPLRTFVHGGPLFTRGPVSFTLGVEVATMEVTITAQPTDLLNGVAWLTALRNGALSGGRILLERFLSDSWTNVAVGTVIWFGGRVGDLRIGKTQATLTVKSDTVLLNVNLPRENFQPECNNTLYDSKCSLTRTDWQASGTVVASGSTLSVINCSLTQAADYFAQGKVTFTSGPNTGVAVGVKSYAPGQLVLNVPLTQLCTNGDTFTALPGCDKLQATCGVNSAIAFTVNTGTSTVNLTAAAHGLSAGQTVFLSNTGGALPSPLSAAQRYWVRNPTTNTFQVSTTPSGSVVTLLSNGSGTNKVSQYGKFTNLPNFRGTPYVPVPETAV